MYRCCCKLLRSVVQHVLHRMMMGVCEHTYVLQKIADTTAVQAARNNVARMHESVQCLRISGCRI